MMFTVRRTPEQAWRPTRLVPVRRGRDRQPPGQPELHGETLSQRFEAETLRGIRPQPWPVAGRHIPYSDKAG